MARSRPLPHDLNAEAALLGAAILSVQAAELLVTSVEPGDFYKPDHQVVAAAIREMVMQGEKPDPVTIMATITESGQKLGGGPALLVSLQAETPTTSNADKYAAIVLDHSARRMFIQQTTEALEAAYDPGISVGAVYETARTAIGSLEAPMVSTVKDADVGSFLKAETDYDWLVPGLLERRDRLILTAQEGYGKSTLFRQLAVQFAASCHPFTNQFLDDPVTCLIVDAENSESQIRRGLRPLVLAAKSNGFTLVDEFLRIAVRTDGLDLTKRPDQRWLLERMAADQPDCLFIGPIYKLHNDDPIKEEPAKKVTAFLDLVRTRHNCAIVMEAHSAYGDGSVNRPIRPYGASLWSRWPEFGLSLLPHARDKSHCYLRTFRGNRDDRDWPPGMRKGGSWLWRPWDPNDITQRSRAMLAGEN